MANWRSAVKPLNRPQFSRHSTAAFRTALHTLSAIANYWNHAAAERCKTSLYNRIHHCVLLPELRRHDAELARASEVGRSSRQPHCRGSFLVGSYSLPSHVPAGNSASRNWCTGYLGPNAPSLVLWGSEQALNRVMTLIKASWWALVVFNNSFIRAHIQISSYYI